MDLLICVLDALSRAFFKNNSLGDSVFIQILFQQLCENKKLNFYYLHDGWI